MSEKLPTLFFGYPSTPLLRAEAVETACSELAVAGAAITVPWVSLKKAGRFIIDSILEAIDSADVSVFDVTDVNHNVMFELGYAIGSEAKIWLLRDESDEAARRNWDRVKTLTTVAYSPFTNSQHIVNEFWSQRPDQARQTIFQSAIEVYLQPAGTPALFYIPSLYETEAGRKLSRRIQREQDQGVRCITADPAEASAPSLTWCAQQVYSADIVVAHFCSPARTGAEVHNARCALIAGLARGMKKLVLMLAEADYASPIDYRDLLYVYPTAKDCLNHADHWLAVNLAPTYERIRAATTVHTASKLSAELASLRLGEPVAENESEELIDYFVKTASYAEVLEKKAMVFVGRKGAGKTANLIRATDSLRADKRNFVCVIKPYSYELEGILALMKQYQDRGDQAYAIESLWKFLIYSEIANVAYGDIRRRPAPLTVGSDEEKFIAYMENTGSLLKDEFAVRLETAVSALLEIEPAQSLGDRRGRIAEALHDGMLRELRAHLGKLLVGRQRVAVLIDNLDKAWQRSADIDRLAGFILGLLSTIGRITEDFAKSDYWRESVTVTLAVFLRSDIFAHVVRLAREPDKIPVGRLEWDNDLLLRVIEERYAASHGPGADPDEVWKRYFCDSVRGMITKEYILSRILPRPRDLIYFCSEAIAAAVNRRSPRVEERDILVAESHYSQFAFEALQVENGVSLSELEGVLYEFVSMPNRMSYAGVRARISGAGIDEARLDQVISHLRSLSFLGVEVADGRYEYLHDMRGESLIEALIRKRQTERGSVNFEIHPAFRSYLEIDEGLAVA